DRGGLGSGCPAGRRLGPLLARRGPVRLAGAERSGGCAGCRPLAHARLGQRPAGVLPGARRIGGGGGPVRTAHRRRAVGSRGRGARRLLTGAAGRVSEGFSHSGRKRGRPAHSFGLRAGGASTPNPGTGWAGSPSAPNPETARSGTPQAGPQVRSPGLASPG